MLQVGSALCCLIFYSFLFLFSFLDWCIHAFTLSLSLCLLALSKRRHSRITNAFAAFFPSTSLLFPPLFLILLHLFIFFPSSYSLSAHCRFYLPKILVTQLPSFAFKPNATMGTRGHMYIRCRGRYFIYYNQFDSYPEGLGETIVAQIPEDPEEYRSKYQ